MLKIPYGFLIEIILNYWLSAPECRIIIDLYVFCAPAQNIVMECSFIFLLRSFPTNVPEMDAFLVQLTNAHICSTLRTGTTMPNGKKIIFEHARRIFRIDSARIISNVIGWSQILE